MQIKGLYLVMTREGLSTNPVLHSQGMGVLGTGREQQDERQ